MSASPLAEFWQFVKTTKTLQRYILVAYVALPLFDVLACIGPPWPNRLAVSLVTVVAELLVFIFVYTFALTARDHRIKQCMLLFGIAACASTISYFGVFSEHVYPAPDYRNRVAGGSELREKPKLLADEFDYQGNELLAKFGNDPEQVWDRPGIIRNRRRLLAWWVVTFATLTVVFGLFVARETQRQKQHSSSMANVRTGGTTGADESLVKSIKSGSPYLRAIENPAARGLVVFVHGFEMQPTDHASLLEAFATDEAFQNDDILPFKYASERWSERDPDEIADELETLIHALWQSREPKRLLIVAHSMGGLIARASLIRGLDKNHPWARSVTRLCLLESTNRGYRPRRVSHKILLLVAKCVGKARLARSMLVGSRFVVRLRLDWIQSFSHQPQADDQESERPKPPETVQLLADSRSRPVVFEQDSDDLLSCGNAEQRRIANVNHYTIAMLAGDHGENPEKYVSFSQIKAALFDPLTPTPVMTTTYPDVGLVAFVVHGIRDYGTWLTALETEIKKLKPDAVVWKKRYPYFSLLNFLRRGDRMRKVNGLVEEYGDHRVVFPNAEFVCAGHSNGTYLLGHAMLDFPGLRFERIFLAGSVLPQEFPWRTIGNRGQVGGLRNDMANGDIPVGFCCAALRISPFHQDLGIGGFRGFTHRFIGPPFHETEWVAGGHGAAVAESRLPEVASYLVTGNPVTATNPVNEVSKVLEHFSRFARFWCFVLLLAVVGIAVAVCLLLEFPINLVVLGIYLLALFLVLARF